MTMYSGLIYGAIGPVDRAIMDRDMAMTLYFGLEYGVIRAVGHSTHRSTRGPLRTGRGRVVVADLNLGGEVVSVPAVDGSNSGGD